MNHHPQPLLEQPWPEGEFRFFQMGFVVDDAIATARKWVAVYGVGPFHIMGPIEQACTYRGAETGLNMTIAIAQAGPVQIELIQQNCDRASILQEVPFRGTAGFHQICTYTADYDTTRAYYLGLGYELASEMTARDGQRVAYFDTIADFGFVTEVVSATPSFLPNLQRINDTCATWDGIDPIRILQRGGYRIPD